MRTTRLRFSAIIVSAVLFAAHSAGAGAQGVEDYLLNSTVLLKHQVDKTHLSFGSGFLVLSDRGKNPDTNLFQYEIVILTNKHVLPQEHSIYHQMTAKVEVRDGTNVITKDLTIDILDKDGKYTNHVALNPAPLVDVAAINVTDEMIKENADFLPRISETHKGVYTGLLLPTAKFKDAHIGIGSEIYLLGYPNGFSDPRNVSPILRMGIISTEPDKDYSFTKAFSQAGRLPMPIPGFLIDANVFPGSSGSMVVRRTNIVQGFSAGGNSDVPYILGIVADSIPISDSAIKVRAERMQLGVVFNSDVLLETMSLLPVKYDTH